MNQLFHLSLNDLRNILREEVLRVIFLFLPMLSFGIATLAVPALVDRYPEMLPYQALILMLLTMQVAAGVGFVVSTMFLDEQDQHLLSVIRTLPMSVSFFLTYRLAFCFLYSFLFALVMVTGTGLVSFSFGESILYASLYAFPAPVIMLIMASFARNKVEGLAIFKGINFLYLLPIAAFFMEGNVKHWFGILPMHWSYQAIQAMADGVPSLMFLGIGLGLHVILFLLLLLRFRQKVL